MDLQLRSKEAPSIFTLDMTQLEMGNATPAIQPSSTASSLSSAEAGKARRNKGGDAGQLPFREIEPHPKPVHAAQLFDEISKVLRRPLAQRQV